MKSGLPRSGRVRRSMAIVDRAVSRQHRFISGCSHLDLAEIAKQERVRLSERTRAGLDRVRGEGKVLGRPRAKVSPDHVRQLRAQGLTWTAVSRQLGVARSTAQVYAAQVQMA